MVTDQKCLVDSEGPVQLALPDQWLWDIIDEFIYQFQAFSLWRSKPKAKTEDELVMLATESETAGGSQLWSCYSVLNVLYSLVQKSRINEYLSGVREGMSEAELAWVISSPRSLIIDHVFQRDYGRVWIQAFVPNAGLLQSHWPFTGSCPAG